MDTLRGYFADHGGSSASYHDHISEEEETGHDLPPAAVGQDERRMQVRAYNFWASLLDNRSFPRVEDLQPEALPDFGPYSVLLDFTRGMEAPSVRFLGGELAGECGANGPITTLGDVPSRSLLSRITDHYMQILANQAPIGFEAEFVNQRGVTILYRGILLPFSSDDSTIDYIYGVINWKELADAKTTDELLLEIDQALEGMPEFSRNDDFLTEWADGPRDGPMDGLADDSGVLELTEILEGYGHETTDRGEDRFSARPTFAPYADFPALSDVARAQPVAEHMALADWLASARELAQMARTSEDRSHQALYAAIGRAYDFSIAAVAAPAEFQELVADAGLAVQDRAPLTPLVKLVFGTDYDKTRVTEYASALAHAHRLGLESGVFATYLAQAPGGLKGVVREERRLRREESGEAAKTRETPGERLACKLRKLIQQPLNAVPAQGSEFTLLVARRLPSGEVVLLGEVDGDVPLLERAARHLLR